MRIHKGNHNGEYKGIDKNEQVVHQIPKHKSKKDTKRWCLGKVGREHDAKWVPKPASWDILQVAYWMFQCTKCKKELKIDWDRK